MTQHVPAPDSGPAAPRRRVALLGAGYIATYHAKIARLLPGAELVAVCDTSLGRARSLADAFGIPAVYGTLDELLAKEPDLAVHVLVPPEHHLATARRLVEAGVPAFLEKPMALTAAECTELVDLAAAAGVRVGVGHNFLFADPYERLRADLAAGVFGPIDALTVTWHKELGQVTGGPFDAWMLRRPENVLVEVGPHLLAHVLDLVGRPERWTVDAGRRIALPTGVPFYRRWHARAEHAGTAIQLNLAFNPGFAEHTVHVRGQLAAATVDFERNTYVLQRHSPREIDFDRLAMTQKEARQSLTQGWSTLADYVLTKAKLTKSPGNPYARSILGAARAFHAPGALDRRVSAEFGRDVIAMCEDVARASGVVDGVVPTAKKGGAKARTATAAKAASTAVTGGTSPVLVLGASGFIGKAFVRHCVAQGRPVRVMVRSAGRLPAELRVPGVEVVEGDLADAAALGRALDGVERVVHLARANVKTWADYQRHEIEMTRTVAQVCLDRGVSRFVYAGTIDSYYAGRPGDRITESTGLDPQIDGRNLYARAKAASEDLLVDLFRDKGLPLVIVRPGIVIGRGGSPFHWGVGMWKHNSVCQIWGSGRNALPFVLVDDVARGLLSALDVEGIEGESFNLVGDPMLSAQEYLDELDRSAGLQVQRFPTPTARVFAADLFKFGVKVAVRFPERHRPTYRDWQSRTQNAIFDCTQAKKVLGWTPATDRAVLIHEGIAVPVHEYLGLDDIATPSGSAPGTASGSASGSGSGSASGSGSGSGSGSAPGTASGSVSLAGAESDATSATPALSSAAPSASDSTPVSEPAATPR